MSVDVRVHHFPPHAVWMAAEVGIDTGKSVECPVRYRNAQYRNEMQGAGIPMPAALVSMPMPSYVYKAVDLLK